MLKKIILTFVTSVIIIGVTGLIGYKLLNKKVEGTETQITLPKVETPKTEETTNAPKTNNSVDQESNAPVKAKTVTTPQVTPTPTAVAACDESRKTELTNKYENDISAATQKQDKIYSDANAEYLSAVDRARESCAIIWDPNAREQCVTQAMAFAATTLKEQRSSADRDYDVTTGYLTFMYGLDMKSAHCSN